MLNWEGTSRGMEEVWLFVRKLRGSEVKSTGTADTTSITYSLVDDIETRDLLTRGKNGSCIKEQGSRYYILTRLVRGSEIYRDLESI